MEPDVVSRSEELPFADSSFDVVVCRVAAHHFDDVARRCGEMARVAGRRVLISDNLYGGEELEEAEKLRDPSHVRNYSEAEWRGYLEAAGARVDDRRGDPAPDRARAVARPAQAAPPEDAERVRELVADRIEGSKVVLDRIVIKAVKS